MALHGSVKAFSLEDLLSFLTASGHQGSLHVTHQEARKTVYLYQGALYFERSAWSFRLGDALVRRGVVRPAQVDEALARQKETGEGRVGDHLVALGYVTPAQILAARRHQVEEELYELFGWKDAFFEFYDTVLPPDFQERLKDPEEFAFPVQSVLVEALRRLDEWSRVRRLLPSERRLYRLSEAPGAAERVAKVLKEAQVAEQPPEEVFSGKLPLAELPHKLGLSRFETQVAVARLLEEGMIRPHLRHELESMFRVALEEDLPLALRCYECALESNDFEGRGRFLDRVLLGSKAFRQQSSSASLGFSARVRGKRAFEVLLALIRQGVACRFKVQDRGKVVHLEVSKFQLVLHLAEGEPPPNVMSFLLSRSPVAEADMSRVREMQRSTGRTLKHILVGGGYVTMDNWLRAQKDAVLDAMFGVLLLHQPFVEVTTGAVNSDPSRAHLDIDIPLLPWLHAEVMADIREWETILSAVPSARAFLELTSKGTRELRGPDDPFGSFDGQRPLEEVMRQQTRPAREFLGAVYERLQGGRLRALTAEDYRARVEAARAEGNSEAAIACCVAAIDSELETAEFQAKLEQLRGAEDELSVQDMRPTVRGELASFSLAEVLQSLHLSKRTGSLRVEARDSHGTLHARSLYFDQGEVYLLTGGADLSEGQDLEAELLAAGSVTEDQLAAAAAQQMKDEVYEIFLWEGAEFEFAADHLPPEFHSSSKHRKIRLNTVAFLMEAVRRATEWEGVRQVVPSDQAVLGFASTEAKLEAIKRHGAEELLLLVDGRHPIADLVRISGVRRFRALVLFAALVREGALVEVDTKAQEEAEADAIVSSDLPTFGVIEEGFVGQLQFVSTLQELAGARLTGVLRITDGRRSKEVALVDGAPYRTQPYAPGRAGPAEGEELLQASSLQAAQDVSECFSWRGARFELLQGTLPPRLQDPEQRATYALDPEAFFDGFAQAGERWGLVADLVPREQPFAFVGEEARGRATKLAGPRADLVELVDGRNTAEDLARLSGDRYAAMSWVASLFEEGLVEGVEPPAEEPGEEETWDLSL